MRYRLPAVALWLACLACCVTSGARAAGTDALTLDKLFIAQNGVALSQFPSHSRLSTSVTVGLARGAVPARWKASSNSPWLKVTASGMTGTALTLTANPAGLAADTLHIATVTVSTGVPPLFGDTKTVRVALWIGSQDPAAVSLSQSAASIAANPVEPWVYVSAGNGSVHVFNVYSGAAVATFATVAPQVGQLVVSTDGTELFEVDTTNYLILAVNAASGALLHTYALKGPIAADFSFAYARPGGEATLFAPGQAAIDVATGAPVSAAVTTIGGFYEPLIVATPDGSRLAIVERGIDPAPLYTYTVTHFGPKLTITTDKSDVSITGENCQAMAITSDGSRLYPACGWPYEFDVYNTATLAQVQTLPAVPYPNNAVIDADGNFVGGVNGTYQAQDVFEFDTAGYLLGAVATTAPYGRGQGNNLLAVSGDTRRVISATDPYETPQTLMFRSLP